MAGAFRTREVLLVLRRGYSRFLPIHVYTSTFNILVAQAQLPQARIPRRTSRSRIYIDVQQFWQHLAAILALLLLSQATPLLAERRLDVSDLKIRCMSMVAEGSSSTKNIVKIRIFYNQTCNLIREKSPKR